MNEDAYMTPKEAARYLKSSASTLAKRRLSGNGPIFFRIGRAIRYRQSDVDAWLEQSASRNSTPHRKRPGVLTS
jgi:excisionase family DNA binding protein